MRLRDHYKMIKGVNPLTGYNIFKKIYVHLLSEHLNINRYFKNPIAIKQMNLEDILYKNKPDRNQILHVLIYLK